MMHGPVACPLVALNTPILRPAPPHPGLRLILLRRNKKRIFLLRFVSFLIVLRPMKLALMS